MKNRLKVSNLVAAIAMVLIVGGASMLYKKLYQSIAQELQQGIDMPEEE